MNTNKLSVIDGELIVEWQCKCGEVNQDSMWNVNNRFCYCGKCCEKYSIDIDVRIDITKIA